MGLPCNFHAKNTGFSLGFYIVIPWNFFVKLTEKNMVCQWKKRQGFPMSFPMIFPCYLLGLFMEFPCKTHWKNMVFVNGKKLWFTMVFLCFFHRLSMVFPSKTNRWTLMFLSMVLQLELLQWHCYSCHGKKWVYSHGYLRLKTNTLIAYAYR